MEKELLSYMYVPSAPSTWQPFSSWTDYKAGTEACNKFQMKANKNELHLCTQERELSSISPSDVIRQITEMGIEKNLYYKIRSPGWLNYMWVINTEEEFSPKKGIYISRYIISLT